MEIKLNIPSYTYEEGLKFKWVEGFEINVSIEDGSVLLFANKEGLISLANHLLNLSQDAVPSGEHIHFSDSAELEDGSVELVLGKK